MSNAGAVAVAVSVSGENEHVLPAGNPVQESLTVPLNPYVGAILRIAVADKPALVDNMVEDALNPKAGVPAVVESLLMAPNSPCNSPAKPAVK